MVSIRGSLTPPGSWVLGGGFGHRRPLPLAVGLALDDELVGGTLEPVDG